MSWPGANSLHFVFKQRMISHTRTMVNELDLTSGWVKVVDASVACDRGDFHADDHQHIRSS